MSIQPTNKDISTRGITTANLSDFSGRDRQVVIQIDDPKGYRPIIMDGQTVGGKTKVVIEKDLEEYATKDELASKADSSALANYATKTELGSYETVANAQATYATKAELAGKADSSALANYATKTELASKAPLANPALTGIPTAPTAAKGTSTTQIATTAFVQEAMGDVQDDTAAAILQAFQDFADEHGITVPETTDTTEG